MKTLTIIQPDDWHLHCRDGDGLADIVAASARTMHRAVVMPNLVPPITDVALALAYRQRIVAACAKPVSFKPLMALYLTDTTSKQTVLDAAQHPDIIGFKLYPKGATTHSAHGVKDLLSLYPLFDTLQELQVPLLIHGEVTDPEVDIFDREQVFIERHLMPLCKAFPALKISLEHISTRFAVEFIQNSDHPLAGTITAHHLWLNRNDLLSGGIKPHFYCLPIVKSERDRLALINAAISGSPKFFLGTDSAPHAQSQKESACGCAGIFTAYHAIEYYAQLFEQHHALDKLEGFASIYGAQFYERPINTQRITLTRQPQHIADHYAFGQQQVVPFLNGQTLNWSVTS